MYLRNEWIQRIEEAFDERSIVWLKGVRRVGKTVLCRSLPNVEYFDCELPRTRRLFEDPEGFLNEVRGQRIVLDEIHRLTNPSEILKIAADHYPATQIIATGSSTLGASEKFRDTLTGRKRTVWLTPMTLADLNAFQQDNLKHRLQRGGLPPFFLADSFPESDYQEWLDSYWAKDIQELFRLERRTAFQRLVELIAVQSGGIFEATRFAGPCEISRQTVTNYLAVLEATLVAHIVRPFSTRRSTELVSAPKVYAFDTGFVCYARGWNALRSDDLGILWEHYVLNEVQASLQTQQIHYWRNKNGHEIDFVIRDRGAAPDAIECKWSAGEFDPKNFLAFRRQYPQGRNWVVSADVDQPYTRQINGIEVRTTDLQTLVSELNTSAK
jgi:uncharacterized protein